jgi:hypothetical protein
MNKEHDDCPVPIKKLSIVTLYTKEIKILEKVREVDTKFNFSRWVREKIRNELMTEKLINNEINLNNIDSNPDDCFEEQSYPEH